MTYKEAINAIQLDGMEITTTAPRMLAFSEGLKKAEEVLERAEKYRWHDIRKDPNDLPNDNRNVEICFEFSKSKCYHTAYYDYEYMEWVMPMDTSPNETFENVIAWREIESFEEKE